MEFWINFSQMKNTEVETLFADTITSVRVYIKLVEQQQEWAW